MSRTGEMDGTAVRGVLGLPVYVPHYRGVLRRVCGRFAGDM